MCCTATVSITPYITAIGGAIVGGLCSLGVGYVLSRRSHTNAIALLKRQEANKAFLAMEASFIPAIRSLRRGDGEEYALIPELFNQQEIAMRSFVWHLSGVSKTDFEEKWEKYEDWQKYYEVCKASVAKSEINQIGGNNRELLIQMMQDIIEAAKKY